MFFNGGIFGIFKKIRVSSKFFETFYNAHQGLDTSPHLIFSLFYPLSHTQSPFSLFLSSSKISQGRFTLSATKGPTCIDVARRRGPKTLGLWLALGMGPPTARYVVRGSCRFLWLSSLVPSLVGHLPMHGWQVQLP